MTAAFSCPTGTMELALIGDAIDCVSTWTVCFGDRLTGGSSFGGVFEYDEILGACKQANPVTNACSCAPGTIELAIWNSVTICVSAS